MQLFAGGISDSFGRKKPFLIGVIVYMLLTLWITHAHSIYEVLSLRFFQGVMVAMMVVPMRAIITDLFEGEELQKVATYMAFFWTLGPIIAPFLGGYLQDYFGWKACFYFLFLYSSISFSAVLFFMPETSSYQHPFKFCSLMKRYQKILSSKHYLSSLLTNSLLYSIVILFTTIAPFFTLSAFHLSAIEYGHLALVMGTAWSIGALGNRFLIHLNILKKTKLLSSGMIISAFLFLACSIYLKFNLYVLMIPALFIYIAGGSLITAHFVNAIGLFPKNAGSANSLLGASIYLISSLISSFTFLLKSSSATPLAIAILLLTIAIGVVYKSFMTGT